MNTRTVQSTSVETTAVFHVTRACDLAKLTLSLVRKWSARKSKRDEVSSNQMPISICFERITPVRQLTTVAA